MATIPRQVIGTRLNRGSSPAEMKTIALSGPNAIASPQLSPRSLEAPFYKTPVDKVGPVVTNQALQNFGNTLLDVSVSLADKRARMLSNDYLRNLDMQLDEMMNGEKGFLRTGKIDTIKQGPEIKAKINETAKALLMDESVPNYVKLYLNPDVQDLTNKYLKQVSNHIMLESKKQAIDDRQYKLDRTVRNLIDNKYGDVTESHLEFMQQLDDIKFGSDLERQAAVDYGYNSMMQYEKDNLIIKGENASKGTLISRFNSLATRNDAISKYVSPEQRSRNNNLVLQAATALTSELDNRRIQQDRQDARLLELALNSIYSAYNNGDPYPEAVVTYWKDSGILSEKDEKVFREQWADRLKRNRKESLDLDAYWEVQDLIKDHQPDVLWREKLSKYQAIGEVTRDEAIELTKFARSYESSEYKKYYDRIEDDLRAQIFTTRYGQFYRDDETRFFAEARREITGSLNRLRDNKNMNDQTVSALQDALVSKYGVEARIEKSNNFDEPTPLPRKIESVSDGQMLLKYYSDQHDKDELNDIEYQERTDRVNRVLDLIIHRESQRLKAKKAGVQIKRQ